jgi:hypothetical protein
MSGRSAVPLWELSSFSEAAIAGCQPAKKSAVPAPSQPRRGSTPPTLDRHVRPQRGLLVGAVELQRGCDSGRSGAKNISSTGPVAASPGLDTSHSRSPCPPAARSLCGSCRFPFQPMPGFPRWRAGARREVQCDVPSANSTLLPTLYLPDGLFIGMRLISLSVWLS